MRDMIMVYADRCTGCRLCELACSLEKTREFNPRLSRMRIRFQEAGFCEPVVCTQCEEEWCVHACPSGAIFRDPKTQIVCIDTELCTGCAECLEACPIGAMGWHPYDQTPFKCDQCGGDPVCVSLCPAGALAFERLVVPN